MDVDSVLPPKDEVERGSERVVREGTRSVEAVEGGGLSGVVSNKGFGSGRRAMVGRGGGGMILVIFLLLEILQKGFRLEESCGRENGVEVIDRCEADWVGNSGEGEGMVGLSLGD